MVSVCLPSDALSQHLLSYLGFSCLGCGVSLHCCSSKVQLMLLTLDKGYLLTATPPSVEGGVAPFGPPRPDSCRSLDVGLLLSAIMGNAGLEETQAGIKIAGRNINNLRHADDTPLWQKVKN